MLTVPGCGGALGAGCNCLIEGFAAHLGPADGLARAAKMSEQDSLQGIHIGALTRDEPIG